MDVQSIHNPLCILGEGPVFNSRDDALYWLDILSNQVWRQTRSGKIERVYQGDTTVGGMAFTPDNDMIICTEKGLVKLVRRADTLYAIAMMEVTLLQDERFNDCIADPFGRLYAGTLRATHQDGKLYLFEKDRPPRVVLTGLRISNGMGFSPNGQFFYHTDTGFGQITRYTYDMDTGKIRNPSVIYKAEEKDGGPDGMTVDTEGNLWIACWGGSQVIYLRQDGTVIKRVPVPALQVSSVTFGGNEFDTLYITTAAYGALDSGAGLDSQGRFVGGLVYTYKPGVRGRTEYDCLI